ncbi:TatD family hydrolase [Alistipes sp.]|uniref:TatD family hydrolase n=1 Tax=Alistipes sp. TaxID=1872444 RepID=UPI003AEFFE0A
MESAYVNIHTHRPTGRGIELRTAGVHPWDADKEDVESIVPLLAEVEAIGEIGLDFLRGPSSAVQYAAFRAQLRIARERGLPVVLHAVRAFEAVMRCLAECEPRAVIFHGFIGSPEQARQALRKGYFLSFGERTFRSPKTLAALRETPPDRLFLETDDSRTPIEAIYARAAEARGERVEELQRATTRNYERIFRHG